MQALLIRLSLTERIDHPSIDFDSTNQKLKDRPDRRAFLSDMFMRKWEFTHYGNRFAYIPKGLDGDFVYGAVGREFAEIHAAPPDEAFAPLQVEFWETSMMYLNLEKGQQVLAIEFNQKVGDPKGIAKALVSRMNADALEHTYIIDSFTMSDERGFFKAVEDSLDPITNLVLTFVVPNVFGGEDETKIALALLRDRMNAKNVTERISNPEGLVINEANMKETANYIAKGGGRITAKAKRKKVYDSENNATTIEIPDEVHAAAKKGRPVSDNLKGKVRR